MYLLERIALQNWYLVDALDIDVKGVTALLGPQGSGKSSLIDAIQTVVSGCNKNMIQMNASASGKSKRTLREYCLGYVDLPEDGGQPQRDSCQTLIALVFADTLSGHSITIGVVLEAQREPASEEVLSRFIAPGYRYSVAEAQDRDDDGPIILPWEKIKERIRQKCPAFTERRTTEAFITDYLAMMREKAQQPDGKHFMRAFSNAIAFKPIDNTTDFARKYLLEPAPLNIEAVRASINRYHLIAQTIADIERKLSDLQGVEKHYRNWARNVVTAGNYSWRAAAAEVRLLAMEYRECGLVVARYRQDQRDLQDKQAAKRAQRTRVGEEATAKRHLLDQGDVVVRLDAIMSQKRFAERLAEEQLSQLKALVAVWRRAGVLDAIAERAPAVYEDALAAGRSLALLAEAEATPEACFARHGAALEGLNRRLAKIEGLDGHLRDQRDELVVESREISERIGTIQEQLRSLEAGRSALSRDTIRFKDMLEQASIRAIPLADVVEVVDKEWQYAIEVLLGRAREALIVPPNQVRDAYGLLYRNREHFHGCTLVKTDRTERVDVDGVPADSVARLLRSENEHALAFIAVRIGGYRCANDENELRSMRRGIMKNGKMTSGLAYSVHGELNNLVLGEAARTGSLPRLKHEMAMLQQRRQALVQEGNELQTASDAVRWITQTLTDLQGPDLVRAELAAAQEMVEDYARQYENVSKEQDQGLKAEVEALEAKVAELTLEIDGKLSAQIFAAVRDTGKAEEAQRNVREKLKSAVARQGAIFRSFSEDPHRRILELGPDITEPNPGRLVRQFRNENFNRGARVSRDDLKRLQGSYLDEVRRAAIRVEERKNLAIGGTEETCKTWQMESPLDRASPDLVAGFAWILKEVELLEQNELRQYKEHANNAYDEMQRTFKEQLLTKLAERFKEVGFQLKRLNRTLDRFSFRDETYYFSKAVNQKYRNLHRLAVLVDENPKDAQAIISGSLDSPEASLVQEAMQELQALFMGDADPKEIEDYRNYFEYELQIKKANGQVSSMRARSLKGSGGEAQLPFYIAIAASLSLAYFPGSQGTVNEGMGLVVFDEAFNKMDVPTTAKLFDFFRQLGLQLLVASAEGQVTTFAEVVDTVVNVSRSSDQRSVYIDSEFLGGRARSELAAANPDHLGLEGFRRLVAERAAAADVSGPSEAEEKSAAAE